MSPVPSLTRRAALSLGLPFLLPLKPGFIGAAIAASKAPGEVPAAMRSVMDPFADLSGKARPAYGQRDKLTYSNTMTWPEIARAQSRQPSVLELNWADFSLPPPPANSSERTERELAFVRSSRPLRTPETLVKIRSELIIDSTRLADLMMADYFNRKKFPATGDLFLRLEADSLTLVLRLKHHFNRVRPSYLDPEIRPCIEVPSHAAYPSGHSTMMHLYAYVLGELFPKQKASFEQAALAVAIRREIAGVHYPSDTAAGRQLAANMVTKLQSSSIYTRLLSQGRKEIAAAT
jgi:membrane-associated phospholipid phosphatase